MCFDVRTMHFVLFVHLLVRTTKTIKSLLCVVYHGQGYIKIRYHMYLTSVLNCDGTRILTTAHMAEIVNKNKDLRLFLLKARIPYFYVLLTVHSCIML